MNLFDYVDLDPSTRAAMQSFNDVSEETKNKAMNNAMLNAGLAMLMNNRGVNSRQALAYSLASGAGAFADGYSKNIEKEQERQLSQVKTAMELSKFNRERASSLAKQNALDGLSPEDRQMISLGVSPDKMYEARQAREYMANRPIAEAQMAPVELPQLGEQQGSGPYKLDVSSPSQQQNIQNQIAGLRARGDHQTADQIVAALVKQGAIAQPMRKTIPDANALAQYAVRGQLAGVKGAAADYAYAKEFLKPDWQQIDSGGQIQFINRNAGQPPTITKTDTPELQWQREKFGFDQKSGRAKDNISREESIRKEFAGLQTSQDWWNVQPVLQAAREAAKIDDKAADLNIVYAIAKIYDPGSVVRESETEMQIKSGSPAEQFKGLFNQVAGGGRLTPTQREKMLQQIEIRSRGYEDAYNARANQYRGIAERYEIDPRNIITEAPNRSKTAEESAPPSSNYSVSAGGKTYYFPDAKSMNNFKLKAGVR